MPQQTSERRATLPANPVGAPQELSLVSYHPENKESFQQQATEIQAVMGRAQSMLFHYVPEMQGVLNRPGLRVVVVDDVQEAWKRTYGSPPNEHDYRSLEAFTHTETDPRTNKATGTVIFLSKDIFRDQKLGDGETLCAVPHVIAVLDHELQHCKQVIHPPTGQVVGQMGVGAREVEAYAGEIADLNKIYREVGNVDVRDYRQRFARGANLDGEKIVDEKVNFRYLSGHLEVIQKRYAEMLNREKNSSLPELPKTGLPIPKGEQGALEFSVPASSPYFETVRSAEKAGLRVVTTTNSRAPFLITDPEGHVLRYVIASNAARTPELLSQALGLQVQAEQDKKELYKILNAEQWGFRALPHEVGQSARQFEILERDSSGAGQGFKVRTTVNIQPSSACRDVQEIGADLYQAWESDLLREVKRLAGKNN